MAESEDDYYKNMKAVGLSILVIGVSIAAVIVAYAGFGRIGPSFSAGVMEDQQEKTAEEYGLPSQHVPASELETPPSLRENATAENVTA